MDHYKVRNVLKAAEMEIQEAAMMIIEGRVDIAAVMVERARADLVKVQYALGSTTSRG